MFCLLEFIGTGIVNTRLNSIEVNESEMNFEATQSEYEIEDDSGLLYFVLHLIYIKF